MKKKLFSLVTIVTLVIVGVFAVNTELVSAEETSTNNCKDYDVYFYFTDIVGIDWLESSSRTENDFIRQYHTGFTVDFSKLGVEKGSTIKQTSSKQITLNANNADEFWTNYKKFNDTLGASFKDGDNTLRVFHTAWSVGTSQDSENITKLASLNVSDLTAASWYDTEVTKVTGGIDNSKTDDRIYSYTATNSRTYSATSGDSVTGVLKDPDNNAAKGSLLAPMLYKLTYNICSPSSVVTTGEHTLTIHYWYDKVGGTVASPDHKATLKEGDKYEVNSPKINEWTPDMEVVRGTMPNKDVVLNVIYTPKTGQVATGIIWLLGLAGLGYGIYYFSKAEQEEKENN